MFVPGALPWEVVPPPLPPLSGLLTMLDGKDGVRPPLLPMVPPVPRTAACVVLPQSTSSPSLTISPRLITTPAHAPYTKASSPPTAPPLKFGVERLLATDTPKGQDNMCYNIK
ncbi:hypothetical protein Pmani_015119 [Petrolisthes manimaculis]|uniref:Uncharacterized protein n=1 Tax=Petrolisthes manimaculis TaxID=1843537 RepID=A0AAE1P3R9_9EUCA|nr:hypothetical protein Pmani_027333 [Petrolisthes manimaculis]KAK4313544.1 hypothetical protein Pmani_015119 [Petrolisthes manimaculis]